MLGAILGDVAGSIYEFNNIKTTDFDLLGPGTHFTDDTVMSIAVAKGAMEGYNNEEKTRTAIVAAMQELGRAYPSAGYGGRFADWLTQSNPKPYNSWGNGSAMRVSSIAWIYSSLEKVEQFAKISAEVTHNHPDAIKGAQAVAAAIFLGRAGASKAYIKDYIQRTYGYDLSATCDEIRPTYTFDVSCRGTVPQAFAAFFEGESIEEVVRLAVSLGGDSDTVAAIAGSIAEGSFDFSKSLSDATFAKLDDRLRGEFQAVLNAVENINTHNAMQNWTTGLGDMNRILRGEPRVAQEKMVAFRNSWHTRRMPKQRAVIEVDIPLTEEDMRILAWGHIPDVMEDHWFAYFDGTNLRYYRSWSGIIIYKAKVERTRDGQLHITKVTINRDPEQYASTNDEKDIAILQMLLAQEVGKDSSEAWAKVVALG